MIYTCWQDAHQSLLVNLTANLSRLWMMSDVCSWDFHNQDGEHFHLTWHEQQKENISVWVAILISTWLMTDMKLEGICQFVNSEQWLTLTDRLRINDEWYLKVINSGWDWWPTAAKKSFIKTVRNIRTWKMDDSSLYKRTSGNIELSIH